MRIKDSISHLLFDQSAQVAAYPIGRTFLLATLLLGLVFSPSSRSQQSKVGPPVYLQEARAVRAAHSGSTQAKGYLAAGQAQPRTLAAGDFNEDGVADLAIGYETPGGGALVVHRGNSDAFAPKDELALQEIAETRFPSPFLEDAKVFSLPIKPDFLLAGYFSSGGHLDLLAAAKGGNVLYVLPGDGRGEFGAPQKVPIPGGISMVAARSARSDLHTPSILVGISGPLKSSLLFFAREQKGLELHSQKAIEAPATSAVFGNLTSNSRIDAAILAGGHVLLLNTETRELERVPLSNSIRAIALGSFIRDRDSRSQMALLTEDGGLTIAVHDSFDPRAFGTAEMRQLRHSSDPPKSEPASSEVRDGWRILETFPSITGTQQSDSLPLMFRTRISSTAADDIMVLDAAAHRMTVVSHANPKASATQFVPGSVSSRPYSGSPIAAIAMRVNIDARPGVVALHRGQVLPVTMMPLPDPTFTVTTTSDTVDANPGDGICADTLGHCSLRAAIMEANAIAGVDTIIVPAGVYQLTLTGAGEAGGLTGDLNITDGVNIVGANPLTTIIEAGTDSTNGIDRVLSINPLLNAAFDTSLSNLTIRFGRNVNSFASDGLGGAISWEASGTGNLTITNCVISDSSTTDGYGGGLAATNTPGGSGTLSISNSTIESNVAQRTGGSFGVGGGIYLGPHTAMVTVGAQILNNQAIQTGGQGGGIFVAGPGAALTTAIHSSTISGNQSDADGGGIHTEAGIQVDLGTVISNNQCRDGAGLYSNLQVSLSFPLGETTTLTNVTLTGNSATGHGGAIEVGSGSVGNGLDVGFSRIVGNSAGTGNGISNLAGLVSARENWWGCNAGPTVSPCDLLEGTITADAWIVLSLTPSPTTVALLGISGLTASFLQDNNGTALTSANVSALVGLPITFSNPLLGSLSGSQSTVQASGTATSNFTANLLGTGHASALVDSASVTANIIISLLSTPDLTITKTHSGNFTQGQAGATYTITVKNVGSAASIGLVTVIDTLPLGLSVTGYSGTGWTCILATLVCTRADSLAAGASYPAITVTVNVANTALASITNIAAVAGGGELNLLNDIASDLTNILSGQIPDLVIAKTHSGNFIQGQTGATYTLTVSNIGVGPTSGLVSVVDTLPLGLSVTGYSGTGWSCILASLICTRSDALAASASYPAITVTVSVANNALASLLNTAVVAGGGELNLLNDIATDATTILQVADLTIVKSHSGNFTQGQTGATYTLTVSNVGVGATIGPVTVVDTLPLGLNVTGYSGTGWSCVLATLICSRSDALAAGASYPAITVTVSVANNALASLLNTAAVAGGGELNLLNDIATDLTTILQVADLTIVKSHTGNFTQGQTGATYTLTVSNVGVGATIGPVTVVDTLPLGLTVTGYSGTGWSCVLATLICSRSDALAAGASYPAITVTVSVANNALASLLNTAAVAGGGELNLLNDIATDLTTILQVADLTIVKSHSGNFTQGQTGATYTLTVSNVGVGPTIGPVTVVDTLPLGLTVTGYSGTGWSCVLATLVCSRSDALAAGASYPAITVTVSVANNALASLLNTAAVAGGGELNLLNDIATDATTILPLLGPDLAIAKTHSGSFTQGQVGALYSITVSNTGTGPTTGTVTVTDTLPSGMSATAMGGAGWACVLATLTCTRNDVLAAAGNYPAITLTVNIASNAPASLTNTASVSGGGEANLLNDLVVDLTTILQIADLTIVKSHTGNFTQGQTGATYTLTVSNVGVGPTIGPVTVVDTLPLGLTVTGYSGTGWSCVLATLICSRSDALAAGASYPAVTVTVSVANNALASIINTVVVAGGGELNFLNDTASDVTTILPALSPDLTIAKSHGGSFTQGQVGATYAISVSNVGTGATSGIVTVVDALPVGLTATNMSGTGWSCVLATLTCTRADALAAAASYPPIALTVNVASNAAASITNVATVSGGSDANLVNNSSSDLTSISVALVSDLSVAKTHSGSFVQGQTGASYSITVSNAGNGATSGAVTVSDTLPVGLTATGISGTGWSCILATLTCTRNDVLVAAASYPTVLVTVNVAANAAASVTNLAVVAGGGETNLGNDTASDVTTVTPAPPQVPDLTISKSHSGNFTKGQTAANYTITVHNGGTGPTSGIVSVVDSLPASMTATAMTGSGWTCGLGSLTCTRSDALAAGSSYPAISLAVNVASNAPASATNTVSVSGGGETNVGNDGSADVTSIVDPPDFAISVSPSGTAVLAGQVANYKVTITPLNGSFSSAVQLSITGLPTLTTAVFNPNSVTPGATPGVSTLILTTVPGDPYVASIGRANGIQLFALLIPGLGIVLSGFGARKGHRRRVFPAIFLFFGLSLVCGFMVSGCASSKNFQKLGTPPGTYTVTVTGVSGSTQRSATAEIIVQVPQ